MTYPPQQPSDPNRPVYQHQPVPPPAQPPAQHLPAPMPQQQWQPPPGTYPPPAGHAVLRTATTTGLPAWMHVIYAIGGICTCGVLWVVWAVHWWFVKSKEKSTTTYGGHQQPPYGH